MVQLQSPRIDNDNHHRAFTVGLNHALQKVVLRTHFGIKEFLLGHYALSDQGDLGRTEGGKRRTVPRDRHSSPRSLHFDDLVAGGRSIEEFNEASPRRIPQCAGNLDQLRYMFKNRQLWLSAPLTKLSANLKRNSSYSSRNLFSLSKDSGGPPWYTPPGTSCCSTESPRERSEHAVGAGGSIKTGNIQSFSERTSRPELRDGGRLETPCHKYSLLT